MFRTATAADLDSILALGSSDIITPLDSDRFRNDLALGRYRLAWTWVAEDQGRISAFALWWALPDARQPASLDYVWASPDLPAPAAVAGALLHSAVDQFRLGGLVSVPEVNLDLPAQWQEDPDARAAVKWRRSACQSIGLTDWNERRQQEWTNDRPLPHDSGRLDYFPADDDAFLDIFRKVTVGSLDVLTQRTLADLGPEAQAQDDLEFYLSLPGDRELWRLASNRNGELVGFLIPSRSAYEASVSYLGVTPEHRGHHYVDDLLAEITRIHVETGATRITGTTDSTNIPMLGAFTRAGYTTTGTRLVGSEPPQPK